MFEQLYWLSLGLEALINTLDTLRNNALVARTEVKQTQEL